MRNSLELAAARIVARIQSIGINFDPEVLSLPGGTAIAVILWLYAGTTAVLKTRRASVRLLKAPSAAVTAFGLLAILIARIH